MKTNFLQSKPKSPKTRLSRVEALEERQLLSATPYENYASETALVAAPLVDSAALVQAEDLEAPETPLVTTGTTWTVTSTSDDMVQGTIRYAIANSRDGDTITFAQSLKGKTITLTGTHLSIVYDITIDASSIWDSANNKPGVTIDADDESRVFYIVADAELIGLNIAWGYSTGNGGAIYANGDIELTNCWIRDSEADGNGGGIFVYDGTTTLTNCYVYDNMASKGGGVMVDDVAELIATGTTFKDNESTNGNGGGIYVNEEAEASLTNCQVISNVSSKHGGGIYSNKGDVTVERCVIRDNSAEKRGGGLRLNGGDARVENTLIIGNSASYGGGINTSAEADFRNCTIAKNTASGAGGGIYVRDKTTRMINSILVLNEADNNVNAFVHYSESVTDIESGETTEVYDPHFRADRTLSTYKNWENKNDAGIVNYVYNASLPLFVDPNNNDFHLAANSQALDVGNDDDWFVSSLDLDGNTRVQNGSLDLGCYERVGALATPTVAYSTTKTALVLNIGAVANAEQYVVQYATNSSFTSATTKTYTTAGSKTISGLTSGTTYYVRVKASSSTLTDSAWKTFTATTPADSLAAPTLTVSTGSASSIVVKIGTVANAESYVLEYAKNSSFTSATTKTYTSAGSKTITGLTASTTYYFRVKATSTNLGDSGWTTASAKTSASTTPTLATPTLSATSTTASSVTLSVGSVANATSYVLQYATNSSFTSSTSKTYTSAGSKTISGLSASTTYYFRVKATAANYTDSAYKSVSAKTQAAGPPLATPAISLSGTNSAIVIKIDAVTGAEKYVVDYSTSSAFASVTTKTYSSAGVKTISGLTAGKWYYVRVKATATDRQDSPVATGKAYTGGRVAMPAVSASAVKTAIVLNIKEVANGDKYVVEYGLKSDYSDATSKTFSAGVRTLSGLTFGKTYYIRVKATSTVANDSMWNELTFAAGQLATPSAAVMKTDSSSINVKCWNSANASGFEVKYATKADFSDAKTVKKTGTASITIPNLNPKTKYYLSARALGDNVSRVNSNWTTTFTATTKESEPLPTPATPTVSAAKTSVVVNFAAVAKATGYVLEYGTDSTFKTCASKTYTSAGAKTISGLKQGTVYYFRLKATGTGYSDSAWRRFDAKTLGGPDAPTVTATVTKTAVVLNIGAVASASSYVVQYSTKSTFASAAEKTYASAGVKTISGLTSGTTYYFRVKAVSDTIGESNWTIVKTTTNSGLPKASANDSVFENYFDDESEEFWELLA